MVTVYGDCRARIIRHRVVCVLGILKNFEQYNCEYMESELSESGKGYNFGLVCSGYAKPHESSGLPSDKADTDIMECHNS